MRRYGLAGNMMLGFALAALGCAGSKGYHRYGAPRTAYQVSPPVSAPVEPEGYAPTPLEPNQHIAPPLDGPEVERFSDPSEIPPPPSFDQGEYLGPPRDREPLSASTTSGLKKLKVPLKLQPISWRSLNPYRDSQQPPLQEEPARVEQRFGHSLSNPR